MPRTVAQVVVAAPPGGAAATGALVAAKATPPAGAAAAARAAPGRLRSRRCWAFAGAGSAAIAIAALVAVAVLATPAHCQHNSSSTVTTPSSSSSGANTTTSSSSNNSTIPAPVAKNEAGQQAFKPAHSWHRRSIILFGDSLTEMGTSNNKGWGAMMAAAYSRRADVVNRGFGGYTTSIALEVLPEMLESAETRRAALAVVWFGANDATDPDGPQAYMTVPPARYAANLKRIAADLKAAGVQHVLIVTPPPVDDAKRAAANPAGVADRRFALTARYAAAAMGAARELALPALDMFKALQELAPGGAWSDRFMLSDGLHFNDEGNAAVFRLINDFVWTNVPAARTDALDYHHPTWEDLRYDAYKEQLAAEAAAAA